MLLWSLSKAVNLVFLVITPCFTLMSSCTFKSNYIMKVTDTIVTKGFGNKHDCFLVHPSPVSVLCPK